MPDTGAPYFIPYVEPTDNPRVYPDVSEDLALAIVAALENIPVTEKRIEAFTGDGSWTVPAGVTYAIAHMYGGGGGTGRNAGSAGGDSSVAFAGGTVTAPGLPPSPTGSNVDLNGATAGKANSGASATAFVNNNTGASTASSATAQYIVAGGAVTPAATIAVVVGAGGASGGGGGAAGGSGYVYIEYYEEV
jgi:hypothetical protein